MLLMWCTSVSAQPLWLGVQARLGGMLQLPSFSGLPGFPSAGISFSPSIGWQGSAGLEGGMVLDPTWTLVGGLGVMHTTSSIRANESTTLSIDGDVVPATIEHTITLQYTAIDASLSALFSMRSARFRVGVIARAALQPSVSQSQRILDPPGVQFPPSTDLSRQLPGSKAVIPMIELGVESNGTSVGSFMIEPNVRIEIPLTSISSDVSWTMVGLSVGVRLRTSTTSTPPRLPDTTIPVVPPFIPPVPSPPTFTQRVVSDTSTIVAAYGATPSVMLARQTNDTVGTEITVHQYYVRSIAPPPPVVTLSVRTTVLRTDPVIVRFAPTVGSDVAVRSWTIEISFPSVPNAQVEIVQGTGEVPAQIDHEIKGIAGHAKKQRRLCTYRLIVQTIDGSTTATSPGEIVLTGR
ncbi:MAG: hypothetical protein JSS89_05655 [Bacteroidetes bacterium]|nr:hypothetical protein [Bacteroidota bacterium]